jgi:hypothetical protein
VGATGQDLNKKARHERYLKFAYQQADSAVQAILEEVGEDRRGRPNSDVFVVSDHGIHALVRPVLNATSDDLRTPPHPPRCQMLTPDFV